MYGKKTAMRFAKEAAWGEAPLGGWFEAAPVDGGASLTSQTATAETPSGEESGVRYSSARIEVLPTAANIVALSEAALGRDANGETASYTLEVSDEDGARQLVGGMVRRFKARAGLARGNLELFLELAGKSTGSSGGFAASGGGGKPFAFAGARCVVSGGDAPLSEFSISVNNNLFLGPAVDGGECGFITSGRQSLTGYLVTDADRRDLVDGDAHSLEITLRGEANDAVISAPELFVTWVREIRSVSHGALQVLYFEGAGGAVSGGLGITLSV